MKPGNILLPSLLLILGAGCAKPPMTEKAETAAPAAPQIGGADAITLHRDQSGQDMQFLGADVLPGRGWNIFQIRAYLPGKGEIGVLDNVSLAEGKALMNGGAEDRSGNKSFAGGGAILVPYANRITGKLTADGKDETADIAGKEFTLPANWGGKKPGAKQYAMHGLILDTKVTPGAVTPTSAEGSLDAGNFGGHWPSQTQLQFKTSIEAGAFHLEVTAKNVGRETLPLGIGWHPYFRLPSGNREQARLHVPALERAPANNYDEVLPLGKIEKVKGTDFDFTAPGGREMGKLFMDDTFTDLTRDGGNMISEVIDPAAKYGVRIVAETPQVTAVQVYAPPDKNFIVVEPQFNLGDPFSPVWKGHPTGMLMLKPGESVTYKVRLELFQPK